MDNFNLNENPELAKWLEGLKSKVAERATNSKSNDHVSDAVYLPVINMSKQFYQSQNKTYPEMQGTINILPVSYMGERVTEVNDIMKCWCPADSQWNSGFTYSILPPELYPESVRPRFTEIRSKLNKLLTDKKITWKECKRQSISVILGYVLMHRNTKGDLISSNLFDKDHISEHKNFPAIILCPNNRLLKAIQSDLDMKPNPIPYAVACYSDTPLADRKGWMSIKFVSADKAFGYDVTVTTELANPIVMPDGILPKDFNPDDARIKLLYSTDPIYQVLDWHQRGKDGEYWNEDSLTLLESYVNMLVGKHSDKVESSESKPI
jgi:hypothetical protein